MKKIDLLIKIANGEEPKIKYNNIILKYNKKEKRFIDKNKLNSLYEIDFSELNDEVEVIDNEELHANNIEFNIYNDKRDCVITLDENDLGIDKLHLDNCYFYKKDNKWYVEKFNFKPINIEEDKGIEKLPVLTYSDLIDMNEDERIEFDKENRNKINEIINYLMENKQ